jgi:hypothetical protein
MQDYLTSKPPSQFDSSWFNWSLGDFIKIDPESNKIAALLYITCKREIGIIYKPTPIVKKDGTLEGIIGNMFSEKCAPAFFKIDGDEIGSCYAIQKHGDIPSEHRPEMPLQADILKGINFKNYPHEISMLVILNLSPLPFGKKSSKPLSTMHSSKKWQQFPRIMGCWQN